MHTAECDKPALTRLIWLHKSGEPPEHPDHQIVYDQDVIDICPSCNGATLESLRHDCFDFEAVYDQYEWYEFEPADGARLRAIASRCERPLDPSCTCNAHKSLRTSAHALPTSSWDAIFESARHRHIVTVSDGPRPAFTLVRTGVELPKAPEKPKEPDTKAVGFVFIGWPLTLVAVMLVWFKIVHVAWYLDAIAFIIATPVTFVAAGVLLAVGSVLLRRKPNNNG